MHVGSVKCFIFMLIISIRDHPHITTAELVAFDLGKPVMGNGHGRVPLPRSYTVEVNGGDVDEPIRMGMTL